MDKLNDLILKVNNNEQKVFESFYNICIDLQKSKEEMKQKLGNYAINKHSKNMMKYFNDSFYDNIVEKFNKTFMLKMPDTIPFDENT